MIEGIDAEMLFGDRGYDTDSIVDKATSMGMQVTIPPKKNRKIQRDFDMDIYKLRHIIENAFLALKQWRGIATRYAKNSSSFLAAVQIHSMLRWARMHV